MEVLVKDENRIVYIETMEGYQAGKFEIHHLSSFTSLTEVGGGNLNLHNRTCDYATTDLMNIESNPENEGAT